MNSRDYFDSPIGLLEIEADDTHLLSISFAAQKSSSSPSKITSLAVNELEDYFNGMLNKFNVPVKMTGTLFQNKVWNELKEIPFGTSVSYTDLALKLGDLKAIRAVGTANGKNKIPIIIPCHRVIGKNGDLVGFSGGLHRKKWLLKHEGIIRGEQIEIFV